MKVTKTAKLLHYLFVWIRQWIEIVCSIISILTFTLYRPSWDFDFIVWSTKYELRR